MFTSLVNDIEKKKKKFNHENIEIFIDICKVVKKNFKFNTEDL